MDPISHAVFGQTLVTAFGRQASPLRTRVIAGVVGALAPDVDALLAPAGWDIYLRAHQVGTHSLAGSFLVAGTVALIARAFARNSPTSDVFAAAWLGCLSHIALDVLSGARIQIGRPLVPGRVGLPLVAMAEPWRWRSSWSAQSRWRCRGIAPVVPLSPSLPAWRPSLA